MAFRKTTKPKTKASKSKAPTRSTSTKKAPKVEKMVTAPLRRSARTTKALSTQTKATPITEEVNTNDDPSTRVTRATRKVKLQAKIPALLHDIDAAKTGPSDKKLLAIAPSLPSPAEIVARVKRASKLSARPKKAPFHHLKGTRIIGDVPDTDETDPNVKVEASANKDVTQNLPASNNDIDGDENPDSSESDDNDEEQEAEPVKAVDPTYFDTTGCIPGVDIAGPDDIHFSKHVNISGQVSAPVSYTGKVPWKSVWKPETLKARGGNKDDFAQFLTACGLEKGYYDGLDATGLASLCSARQNMNFEAAKKEESEKKEKEKAQKVAARALAKKAAKPKATKPKPAGDLIASLIVTKGLPKKIPGASKNTAKPSDVDKGKAMTKETAKANKAPEPSSASGLQIIEENPAAAITKPKRKRSREDDGDNDGEKHPAQPAKKVKVNGLNTQANKKSNGDAISSIGIPT